MSKAIHRLRLFFCFFSGEDDYIIRKCNGSIQLSFALIGFSVQLVFVLCWVSAALFMSHVFDGSRWISVPVGILWALLITNLYLLLLYTISPALLPAGKKKRRRAKDKGNRADENPGPALFSFSLLFRIALISFLAIILAQPFNVWFFAPHYEYADKFATAINEIWTKQRAAWLVTALFCGTMLLPVYFKYQVRSISSNNFTKDFGDDKAMIYLREQLAHPTDHRQVAKQILAADINVIRTSDFYFQKTLLEYRIVLEEYERFKVVYGRLLMEYTTVYTGKCWAGLMPYLDKLKSTRPEQYLVRYAIMCKDLEAEPIEKYEYWADPPFRTAYRSTYRKQADEADLLKTLYSGDK